MKVHRVFCSKRLKLTKYMMYFPGFVQSTEIHHVLCSKRLKPAKYMMYSAGFAKNNGIHHVHMLSGGVAYVYHLSSFALCAKLAAVRQIKLIL